MIHDAKLLDNPRLRRTVKTILDMVLAVLSWFVSDRVFPKTREGAKLWTVPSSATAIA